ncbi:hypothetical protein GCM10027425_04680 [Alteromonas gracilis]
MQSSTPDPRARELVLRGRWTPDAEAAVTSGAIDTLVLNQGLGFDEPGLQFLEGLPLRSITVIDRRVDDLRPLYGLASSLKALTLVTAPTLSLDLGRFRRLRQVSADWGQIRETVDWPSLTSMYAGRYGAESLEPLSGLTELKDLRLKDRPKLRTLEGLPSPRALQHLVIAGGRRLADFSAISDLTALRSLILEGCNLVESLDFARDCLELRHLDVSECGAIASIRPLSDLVKLESVYLYGSTLIQDRDLEVLLRLPRLSDLRIQSRRAYRPSVEEIRSRL